jgi:hypothetical protein
MFFLHELAYGATQAGASDANHFPLAFLFYFSVSEWQTLVSSVSKSFEIEFD